MKLRRSRDRGEAWEELETPAYPQQPEGAADTLPDGQPWPWRLQQIGALEAAYPSQPRTLFCGTIHRARTAGCVVMARCQGVEMASCGDGAMVQCRDVARSMSAGVGDLLTFFRKEVLPACRGGPIVRIVHGGAPEWSSILTANAVASRRFLLAVAALRPREPRARAACSGDRES
ncbi:hypothetical protein [Sorangium sp. So ce233]|uniref:hypothetical protein n=1 Tax=Sorangium sp. So ce233 TaxID=3133290 RepID=UPI003F5EF15E